MQNELGKQANNCVYLVGAGPGDPDLLTVKALRLIQSADAVVYDRLVSDEILALIPAGVTRIYAGKAPGQHHMPQERINDLLVQLGRGGYRVVRLKGGDPFIFGRGSEEASTLARHQIPFEVVPGITAAAACAAYAGIPLSHRGLASDIHFVTGHCRENQPLDLDWKRLADPQATLAVYMGLANLPQLCRELEAAGLPADTAVAAIENGTTRRQRRLLSRLGDLPQAAKEFALRSPSMLVIGRVVELAEVLDWFAPVADSAVEDEDRISRHG
jgi:uroporphyrin-III C-methyltransferase/precorrin-2 dehydrogenase/sirohydrochlorin ferrochelatase/uroporphyrin-III C-methyltransferase